MAKSPFGGVTVALSLSTELLVDRLSVAEIAKVRAELPRGKKSKDVALMRACHAKLHGVQCRVKGCAAHDGRMNSVEVQRAFFNALRPLKAALSRKCADERIVSLDFVTGQFQVRLSSIDCL